MKEFLKKVKFTSLVWSVLFLALGMTFVMAPTTALVTCTILLGSLLALGGILDIASYFLYGYEPFGFMTGLLKVAFGIVIICCNNSIATSGIFAVLFGLVFLFESIINIQNSLYYHKLGSRTWWVGTVFGALMFVLSIITLCNPFDTQNTLLIFLGIAIIIDALFEIVSIFMISSKARKVKRTLKEMFAELTKTDNIIDVSAEDEKQKDEDKQK